MDRGVGASLVGIVETTESDADRRVDAMVERRRILSSWEACLSKSGPSDEGVETPDPENWLRANALGRPSPIPRMFDATSKSSWFESCRDC